MTIGRRTKNWCFCSHFWEPAKVNALKEIADDNDIVGVEDAAQSHGADYKVQKIGNLRTMGCFSSYTTKT